MALRRLRSAITTKLPATTPNQAPRDQLMMMPMSSAPVIAPQAAASARWIGLPPPAPAVESTQRQAGSYGEEIAQVSRVGVRLAESAIGAHETFLNDEGFRSRLVDELVSPQGGLQCTSGKQGDECPGRAAFI